MHATKPMFNDDGGESIIVKAFEQHHCHPSEPSFVVSISLSFSPVFSVPLMGKASGLTRTFKRRGVILRVLASLSNGW